MQSRGPGPHRGANTSRRAPLRPVAASALFLALALGSGVGLLAQATPAVAAGDQTLDHLIVANPEPGWTEATSQEQAALTSIRTITTNPAAGTNATGAIKAWRPPGPDGGTLAIELLNFPSGIPDLGAFSASTTCAHSNGRSIHNELISSVPNSSAATCVVAAKNGTTANAVVTEAAKGTYVILVFSELPSTSPVTITVSDLASIISPQYDALPGGSSATSTVLVVLGAVVIALAALGLLMLWRNSRRNRRPEVVFASAEETLGAHWTAAPSVRVTGTHPTATETAREEPPLPAVEETEEAEPGVVVLGPTSAPEPVRSEEPELATEPAPEPEPEPEPESEPQPEPQPEPEPQADVPAASSPPPPAEGQDREPGWYPENEDQTRQYYWDGEQVAARIVWDGNEWVEVD